MATLQLMSRVFCRAVSCRKLVQGAEALTIFHLKRTVASVSMPTFSSGEGVGISSTSNRKSQILCILERLRVTDPDVLNGVVKSLEKVQWNADDYKNTLSILMNIGISPSLAAEMINLYPELASLDASQIYEAWNTWSDLIPQGSVSRDLIRSAPWLLSEDSINIREKLGLIRAVVGPGRFAAQVLKNSPFIMYKSTAELQEICNYLSMNMFVRNMAEYYKSSVLGCSFSEIVLRHVFLVRCGRYVRPNPRQSEFIPTGNPTLSEIYDTTPEEFATRVAGLTTEEFYVFRDLFANETADAVESDDSDYESDTDSE